MADVDPKREATASIRGYLYQIDAALLAILEAGLDEEIVIEGIEDFDRYGKDIVTYSQVKYYSGTNLTRSVLRDPLFKLFEHFRGLDDESRAGKNYILYGFYSSIKIPIEDLAIDEFKQIMRIGKRVDQEDGSKPIEYTSLIDGLGVDDHLIGEFCKAFRIIISEEFFEHKAKVISAIQKFQNVSLEEAQGFHYPRAFEFVAAMATRSNPDERTTTRRTLQAHLRGSQAVHRRWLMREKGEAEYGRYMRQLYFRQSNIAGVARAFSIEISTQSDTMSVVDQAIEIAKKWSSADKIRMPNKDRNAPFILLRNATPEFTQQVKGAIYDAGVEFVDGYPYKGSEFRSEHLHTPQTAERRIALRFVDNQEQLLEEIECIDRKICRLYDFYIDKPLIMHREKPKVRMVSIPVDGVSMIKTIV